MLTNEKLNHDFDTDGVSCGAKPCTYGCEGDIHEVSTFIGGDFVAIRLACDGWIKRLRGVGFIVQ